jgi:hypothetical protein
MGWIKKATIGLATVLFFVVLAALLHPAKPRSDQIREGCERKFESEGVERVQQCQIQIMVKEHQDREQQRMERAAR